MNLPKISFEALIAFPEVLKIAIQEYNVNYDTDFCIAKIIDDDLPLCTIEATKFTLEDVFNLGYKLSVTEYHKKSTGEISW